MKAFFFHGDALLLPMDCPDSQIETGIPSDLVKNFNNACVFEIPSLETPGNSIQIVSVIPGKLPQNWKIIPVRQVLAAFSVNGTNPGDIVRACHLAQWERESAFCGTCGAKNNDLKGEAMRQCPVCGRQEFPRICPAVIVIITGSENRILLAHNKKFKPGVYSLISGFTETGETLEETAAREIREEVNIEVSDIAYIKSQMWPFPNSLMLGFSARYLSGTVKPDGDEIIDARWYTKDNLPDLPAEGSLSRYLIGLWLDGIIQ